MNTNTKIMTLLLVGSISSVMVGSIWDKAKKTTGGVTKSVVDTSKKAGSAVGSAATTTGNAIATGATTVVNALHTKTKIPANHIANAACTDYKWTGLNELEATCVCYHRDCDDNIQHKVKTFIIPGLNPEELYYIFTLDKDKKNPKLEAMADIAFRSRSDTDSNGSPTYQFKLIRK